MNKRIEYIDICKAIAIFAMVFCHVGLRLNVVDNNLDRQIHLWHMPIFFILSGMLLNSTKWLGWKQFGKFTYSRLKSILVPYLFWGGICNLYLFVVSNYLVNVGKVLSLKAILVSSYDFTCDGAISAFNWFLPAMFITEALFVVLSNILGIKKRTFIIYMVIAMLGMMLGVDYSMQLPLALYTIPFTIGFFAFGFIFRKNIMACNYKTDLLSILLFVFFFVWYFLPVGANVRTSNYHPQYFCWFICIAVSLSLIMIIKHFECVIVKWKGYGVIRMIGKNTLLIYLLHLELLRVLPIKQLQMESVFVSTLCQIIITTMVIGVLLLLVKFVNKYASWSLGKF